MKIQSNAYKSMKHIQKTHNKIIELLKTCLSIHFNPNIVQNIKKSIEIVNKKTKAIAMFIIHINVYQY